MKAVCLTKRTGPEGLSLGEVPPRPLKGEVVVRVHATAVTSTEFN